jgi:hypothetical protein
MAVKSKNRTNVFINKNFVIVVLEYPKENHVKKSKITTANKLSNYLKDEKLKISLFDKVIDKGLD